MNHHDVRPAAATVRADAPPAGGAAAAARGGDPDQGAIAIELLHQALAIAQAVVRRSERQYVAAVLDHAPAVAAAALEHANDAKIHADRLAERIGDLGGEREVCDLTPYAAIGCRASEPRAEESLSALLGRHLATERDTSASYREIAAFFATFDKGTQALIEDIASDAEQRARELAGLQREIPNF
jgi:bacterioferritin (cytochrome b1)